MISYSKNIYESGTTTLTAGTAHADFPLARIYDRNITDLFVATAAETIEIRADQGATGNIAIDTCIIAAGHNLDGETIDIQYSDNGSVWNDATAQFVGAAGTIIKTLTGGTRRYWRVKITSPSSAVEIPEIFLSPGYTWETLPSYPLSDISDVYNIKKIATHSGDNLYLKKSELRRVRNYNMKQMQSAQKTNLDGLWSDWGGYKPFYQTDHEDTLLFVSFEELNITSDLQNIFEAVLSFKEVII